jgi:hypothetical protein
MQAVAGSRSNNGNGYSYRTDIADSQNFVRPLLLWTPGSAIP